MNYSDVIQLSFCDIVKLLFGATIRAPYTPVLIGFWFKPLNRVDRSGDLRSEQRFSTTGE